MDLSPLCGLMDHLAADVWQRTVDAAKLGIARGEVTTTDDVLLGLARFGHHHGNALGFDLCVKQTASQAEETRTGADFEIWLEVEDDRHLGYSVQAKRATKRGASFSYSGLGHRAPAPQLQYDTLLRHAAVTGTLPVHLFYNGWVSGEGPDFLAPPEQHLYGCAVIPTLDVKWLREGPPGPNHLVSTYALHSRPWSTLFRWPWDGPDAPPEWPSWPPSIEREEVGLHIEAVPIATPAAPMTTDRWDADREQMSSRGFDRAESLTLHILHSPLVPYPGYVQQAIDGAELPNDPSLPRFVVLIRSRKRSDRRSQ